jgi:hypothetical protein
MVYDHHRLEESQRNNRITRNPIRYLVCFATYRCGILHALLFLSNNAALAMFNFGKRVADLCHLWASGRFQPIQFRVHAGQHLDRKIGGRKINPNLASYFSAHHFSAKLLLPNNATAIRRGRAHSPEPRE